jgi:hypothetical protein
LFKSLDEQGGYALTHFGVLTRTDGVLFGAQDGHRALRTIVALLSFAQGLTICTLNCAVDDPKTLANEDNCPALTKNICAAIELVGGKTENFCLQRCTPKETGNDCPAQLACSPRSTRLTKLSDVAVCAAAACIKDSDCPVLTAKICDPITGTGCSGVEVCTSIDASTAICTVSGNCQANGLCGPHGKGSASAKIGDPCQGDTDCGNAMTCSRQQTVGGSVVNRNGYCFAIGCAFSLLTSASCPAGSTCNLLYYGGACQRNCALSTAGDCRGYALDKLGDYECYDWSNFTLGSGTPIAAGPVCGETINCDFLTNGCAALGLSPNSTNMTCRNPATNLATSNPADPAGLCLDNTASGPLGP